MSVFVSDEEEAAWWFKNRAAHGAELLSGVETGEAKVLTRSARLDRMAGAKEKVAPIVALRIPEAR